MTYKELAIKYLDEQNIMSKENANTLMKIHDVLKNVNFVDDQIMMKLKPLITDEFMKLLESDYGVFCEYEEYDALNLLSNFRAGMSPDEKSWNLTKVCMLKCMKPYARLWSREIVEKATEIKKSILNEGS